MTARISTGLANKMMATGSFKATMALGFIDIYSGPQPASADAAATGTKLVTLFSDGVSVGLSLESTAVDGVLAKLATETWSGTAIASGNAGWFRFREASDSGVAASATAARFDGAIATSGAEMNLGTVFLALDAPFTLKTAVFTMPKAA